MADIVMPTAQDWSLASSMNPYFASKVMDQANLARQFADESYNQQQNATQKGFLENQFSEQDNPNRVQERILSNQGKEIANANSTLDNQIKGMSVQRAQANQQNLLNEDQRKAAISLSNDEMTQFAQHVDKMMISDDPMERQRGFELQKLIPAFQAERRKHQDALDIKKQEGENSAGVARINKQGLKDIEQMRIDAGKYVKAPKNDYNSLVVKFNSMNPATRLGVSWTAITTGINPFNGQPLTEDETKQFQAMHDQDQATVDAGNQARAAGGPGITPTVTQGGGIQIQNRAPVTVAPGGAKLGTAENPIKLK